jgi:hypothetical protein
MRGSCEHGRVPIIIIIFIIILNYDCVCYVYTKYWITCIVHTLLEALFFNTARSKISWDGLFKVFLAEVRVQHSLANEEPYSSLWIKI